MHALLRVRIYELDPQFILTIALLLMRQRSPDVPIDMPGG
jgi:hypothetical protein